MVGGVVCQDGLLELTPRILEIIPERSTVLEGVESSSRAGFFEPGRLLRIACDNEVGGHNSSRT